MDAGSLDAAARTLIAADRAASVDEAAEHLAALLEQREDLSVVALGESADGTPIFAAATEAAARRVLFVGGVAGDTVSTPGAAVTILEHFACDGWQLWCIPALDIGRLRHNEGTLQAKLDAAALVAHRQSPWGPGEDPEQNLPADHPPLWQPDHVPSDAPEQFVASSPESVALRRAIDHIRPDLVVACRETLAGGIALAASQDLDGGLQKLLDAAGAAELPVHRGPKQRTGRQSTDQPEMTVLPVLEEEMARLKKLENGDARYVGGISAWQAAAEANEDSVYVAVDLPRLTDPAFADDSPSTHTRDVTYTVEERERNGKPAEQLITRLRRPGHPADGAEIRVESAKGAAARPGDADSVAALSGWLACEALHEQKATLSDAAAIVEDVVVSCRTEGFQRSLQLLRAIADGREKTLKAYQTNKRFGRQATVAEALHWHVALPAQTAAIIAEVRRGLLVEDDRDLKITEAIERLDALIAACLQPAAQLRVAPPGVLAAAAVHMLAAAIACVDGGEPALVRARARVREAEKLASQARKHARNLKNLGRPRGERQEADEAAAAEEEALAAAQRALAALADDPAPEDAASAQEPPAAAAPQSPDAPASELVDPEPEPDSTPPADDGPDADKQDADGAQAELSLDPDAAADANPEQPVASPDPEPEPDPDAASDPGPDPAAPDAASESIPGPAAAPAAALEGAGGQHSPQEVHRSPSAEETVAPARQLPPVPLPDSAPPLPPLPDPDATADDERGRDVEPEPSAPRPPEAEVQPPPAGRGGVDLDEVLPSVLRMEPEWGRGPLDWSRQLPDPDDRPFSALVEQALGGELHPEPASASEPQEPPSTSAEIEISDRRVEPLGQVNRLPVGFIRRRVDLPPVTPEVIPPLAAPLPTGGTFQPRVRRISRDPTAPAI